MWNEIHSQADIKAFMELHYFFHDSCIKEIRYISGAYVDKNLSMHPVNDQRRLSVIIQRQFEKHSVIELEFDGLKMLKLFPNDENYTCEILDSTMFFKDNFYYWCDCGGITEESISNYDGIVICASNVRWRVANEYIGDNTIFVPSPLFMERN